MATPHRYLVQFNPKQTPHFFTDILVIGAGIAGLRAARNEVCVFLPVDVPFANAELVCILGEACRDAAVPASGPLPGAYARSALPMLERRLADGELALRDALAELDAVTLDVDPSLLVNVNAPEELGAL